MRSGLTSSLRTWGGVHTRVSRVESYKTQLGTTPENVTVLLPALYCPQN